MEDRHTISEPRLITNPSNPDIFEWEVDVYRDNVDTPVDTIVLNSKTLPPRKSKKGKVVWRLPTDRDTLPSFGTDERRRILDLFREHRKLRKKLNRATNLENATVSSTGGGGETEGGAEETGNNSSSSTASSTKEGEEEEKVAPESHNGRLITVPTTRTNPEEKHDATIETAKRGEKKNETNTQKEQGPAGVPLGDPYSVTVNVGARSSVVGSKVLPAASTTVAAGVQSRNPPALLSPPPGFGTTANNAREPPTSNFASLSLSSSDRLGNSPPRVAVQHPQHVHTTIPQSKPQSIRQDSITAAALHAHAPPPIPSHSGIPPTRNSGDLSSLLLSSPSSLLGTPTPPIHQTPIPTILPKYICLPPTTHTSTPTISVQLAKRFLELYYPLLSYSNPAAELLPYYTPRSQKSISINGAHSVVTGYVAIAHQFERLRHTLGGNMEILSVVAHELYHPGGVLIMITGVAHTNLVNAAALEESTGGATVESSAVPSSVARYSCPFSHTATLVPMRNIPVEVPLIDDGNSGSNNMTGTVVIAGYQIHNDAFTLLSGEAYRR